MLDLFHVIRTTTVITNNLYINSVIYDLIINLDAQQYVVGYNKKRENFMICYKA